jgi:hypothetical protein
MSDSKESQVANNKTEYFVFKNNKRKLYSSNCIIKNELKRTE